jgi:hypothetical protein
MENLANPFVSAEAARDFILAGKATFTLRSKATDARFTFKVTSKDEGKIHFVSLLNGSDNETSYSYLGHIRQGFYTHGKKSKIGPAAPSAMAMNWTWGKLVRGGIPETLEIWHEGRCGRCGRKLTVPSSIASGLGPECAQR